MNKNCAIKKSRNHNDRFVGISIVFEKVLTLPCSSFVSRFDGVSLLFPKYCRYKGCFVGVDDLNLDMVKSNGSNSSDKSLSEKLKLLIVLYATISIGIIVLHLFSLINSATRNHFRSLNNAWYFTIGLLLKSNSKCRVKYSLIGNRLEAFIWMLIFSSNRPTFLTSTMRATESDILQLMKYTSISLTKWKKFQNLVSSSLCSHETLFRAALLLILNLTENFITEKNFHYQLKYFQCKYLLFEIDLSNNTLLSIYFFLLYQFT